MQYMLSSVRDDIGIADDYYAINISLPPISESLNGQDTLLDICIADYYYLFI